MKMWSGRFRQPLDPGFERWQRSFDFDRRLLTHELAASSAHARALANAGIVSSSELISILQGLERIAEQAAGSPAFLEDSEAEDVHHFVEKNLVNLIGDTGYKLHSGRSRNEQIATDLRLYIRVCIDQLRAELAEFLALLVDRAERSGNTAMPAYTHLQRAEPVLMSHWLLAYAEMFIRDADRLADCRKRLNFCPLGSGAVAGTTPPLDRRGMAIDLGFDAPTFNSIDATSDRDFVLEFVNALSMIGLHLSRWAEEMIIFSSREFDFVHLPEAYSTGSSAMPQKKNPDLLELTRGKAARIIGAATTRMKTVEFNLDRMQEAARSGFMNAWAAATYLVQRGVPFRLAHEQIGKAVQLCLEKGCELQDLSVQELRQLNPLFDEDFYSCLDLASVLALHDVPGGTAPAQVRRAIADAKRRIDFIHEEAHAHA
ncbi:MAG: argininosuccinate lyase [Acidobacteriales bacterium 13_2_20CM_2_55_5]|nr:MAG: argininosuccinate lyase [Acidobacteriales bacterium 13_2_20CM_2_55_5]